MVAKKSEGAGPRITVKGNQNIIQSGSPGASAGIHLDAGSKAQIADALKQVRDALNALTPEGMPTRAETLATISEAEAELAKEAPNKIKLPALLQGVGGAIQTVAAVEPAYLTLKGALALIGLYV